MPDLKHPTLVQKHIALKESWLCEALRLKETQWGQLDDRAARLRAACEPTAARQIVARANLLGETSGVALALGRVQSGLWIALIGLLVIAALVGGSAALAALGAGLQPVNVVSALVVLLGVNLFSLVVWLVTLIVGIGSGGWLAQSWQWLVRKLATGPEVGLAGQAWWSLWQQAGGLRWVLSGVTHASWLVASLAMLAVLYFTLSMRHFSFAWETTLLSADSFVAFTQFVGAVPQWFGFAIPDSETVRASGHLSRNSEQAQALWASWLTGALVCYGVLPRALLLLASLALVARAWPRTQPQLHSPYYQALAAKMWPAALPPEGLVPPQITPRYPPRDKGANSATYAVITGIELEGEWPPLELGRAIVHTVMIDSRDTRNMALGQVAQLNPRRLVIACDARHTPDRGTLRLIAELASYASKTLVWLQPAGGADGPDGADGRIPVWKNQLHTALEVEVLVTPLLAPVSEWLGRSDD
ncbi:MAG: DUF2868 domain-containing protein [Candidatus Methylopumilus sp.]|nr:DUF2868 domain-containing protein [Candidatus Methylopumilus sp.]